MKTFRDALLYIVDNDIKSLRSIAVESGVSYEQLKKVKQGKTENTNVEDARRIAKVFNQDVETFIKDPGGSGLDGLIAALRDLEPLERQILMRAAKAQIEGRDQSPTRSDEE